jgi:hypothetical protein
MSRVIYGLNVNQFLSEVANKPVAIQNLGIDIRDLDIIRDINASPVSLDKEDVRLISNLKSDIRAVLYSLRSTTSFFTKLLTDVPIVNFTIKNDLIINNQISATAYKFNYYDYNDNSTKTADVSTSRNSSWSSFSSEATAPIFYGGSVEIIPTPATDKSTLTTSALEIKTVPEPLIFEAQEPTHLIKITVNGVEQEFYAMKGIPLIFDGFFRNANFQFTITRTAQQPRASIILENLDNNQQTVFENLTTTSVNFFDFRTRPKRIKFYYNPNRITRLILRNMVITTWPNVILPAITNINIAVNNFNELPNFGTLAPALRILNVEGNNLSRTGKTANEQLNTLPTTIEDLIINGCFSDSTPIDLTAYTNLRSLNFNSNYAISANNFIGGQIMNDLGPTPSVFPDRLVTYNVLNQRYRRLHVSVTQATNLENLNIRNNRITADSNNNQISLVSTKLRTFNSDNNSHNLVNVNNRQDLTSYIHRNGNILTGNATVGNTFQGCRSLNRIDLYATFVDGDIGTSFANLLSLQFLDIRFTRLRGRFTKDTFANSNKLQTLLIQRSLLGLDENGSAFSQFADGDTFEQLTELRTISIIDNRNIQGSIPNFIFNKKLSSINIQTTGFSGNLQSYNSLPVLNTLIVRDCLLAQQVPEFESNSLDTIRLEFNLLSGSLPEFKCSSLRYFSINNNQLTGLMPNFANCNRLETLILSNNQFNGYTTGSLELCTRLRIIDFSNCRLTRTAIQIILADLRKNYDNNRRTGVRVNLLGNNYVLSDVLNSTTASADLNYLRSQGWSISI